MTFCLPIDKAEKFLRGLKNKELDPNKLMDMTSAERRKFFGDYLGPENAKDVNALFESKLLLKNQQQGIITWAKKVGGLKAEKSRDVISRVEKLEKALSPDEEKNFLQDLAEQKLGVEVTFGEAKTITTKSKLAAEKKSAMLEDISNVDKRMEYGRALVDLNEYIDTLKPANRSFRQKIVNMANVPRSMMASFDLSAPFIQGWGMMTTKPFWKAFRNQFKYFASEKNFKELEAFIISHPDYALAKDAKLGLAELSERLSLREESIQSSLVEKIPGIGRVARASNRAFTGFLNEVRFNRFVDLLNAARLRGENVTKGSKVLKDLANVVNNFTGRGRLPFNLENASAELNALFFSPRKIAATIEMFNPQKYLDPRISPTARIAATRQLVGSLIATSAVVTLAGAAGAEIDFNPISTNFMKVKIGNTTFDMTGGNAIYMRLLARLAANKQITSTGKLIEFGEGYKPMTRGTLFFNYFRGKLSPLASAFVDALYGENQVGVPFSVPRETYEKLTPILIQSFIDFAMYDADNTVAILPALLAIFGVDLRTDMPKR